MTILPRRVILILSAFAAVLLTAAVQAGTLKINLVMSDSSPPYRQFADSFRSALAASKADANLVESALIIGSGADLIVAVGMKAAELAAAQIDTPVLVAMVPEAGYRELLAQMPPQATHRMISAIYLDQTWDRRLDFLRAALPELRRIGVLYSPDTSIDIESLRKDMARRGSSLVAEPVASADKLFPALERVLIGSDVLLAIPDSAIYSSGNIRNILLTSYRHNVPLIGLSKAYVNAGALCAIFSTPEQLGVQAGEMVFSFLRNRRWPTPQYPVDFSIEVNQQVARSLQIELSSGEEIRGRMGRFGGWKQ